MGKKLILILSTVILSLTVGCLAQAEGKPIKISAQSSLAWELAEGVLTVTGDVHLEYEDFTLNCQRLVVNTETQVLEAFQDVRYQDPDGEITADYFRYDTRSETASFRAFSAVFTGDGLATDAYLHGERLTTKGEDAFVSGATFSGCDRENPHYHLKAVKIEYYPGERLVARKVSYYEGHFKLFTLPVLVVSLKESRWEAPKLGYNSEDGWYIKTTYNYYRNPNSSGSLFLDYYQKKGWGTGFKHQYRWERVLPAAGWFYFYTKENGDSGTPPSYHTAFSLEPELPEAWRGKLEGEYKADYYQGQLEHNWGGRANLSWNRPNQRVALDYSLLKKNPAELYPGSVYQRTRASVSVESRPRPDLRYAATTNFFTQSRVDYPKDDLTAFAQAWVSQDLNDYRLQFKVEHQYNPVSPASDEIPNWKSYTVLPEVRLTTKRLSLGGRTLPLRASISASRVQEEPGNLSTMKASGQLVLTGLNYRPAPGSWLNFTASATGSYYDTNHGQAQMTTRAIYRQQFSPYFRSSLTHNWTGRVGVSPLTYDLTQPVHNLQGRLDYTTGRWRAGASTGYDLLALQPEDLEAEVSYRHSQRLYSSAQVAYALPEGAWEYVKLSLRYDAGKERELQGSIYYDFLQETWQTVSLSARQRLNPDWLLEAGIDWDETYGGRLRRGEVSLTKDLHCRELRISLDAVRKEIWFELIFKILPGEPLRLGASDRRFLVDLEFLEGEV
ncbi:MAG: LPS-assembly protein LptD [Firmicutes bacterium]|nr:LPS-assembly protein LptD [Bacillota bacterium]